MISALQILLACAEPAAPAAPATPEPTAPAEPAAPAPAPPTGEYTFPEVTLPVIPPGVDPRPEDFMPMVRPLLAAEREAMTPSVWREGCPVPLDDLVRIEMNHFDAEGSVRRGALVVHRDAEPVVTEAFGELFLSRFPIARMEPVEAFGGDDDASMTANNTSAFNCRHKHAGGGFSRHSFGDAVDINPLWNPYVARKESAPNGLYVAPEAGRPWADRARQQSGMLVPDSPAVESFTSRGWGWGGTWSSVKDWQHMSRDGT